MVNCLFVGFGGFIGSVCRYLLGLIPLKTESTFPLTTFVINIVGAFLIGVIVSLAGKYPTINPKLILLLKVGVCGGFTTFSTFAYEVGDLFSTGHVTVGIVYAFLSFTLGVAAVYLGQALI